MKRILFFLAATLLTVSMQATITIENGQKYYFVCKKWNTGSMLLGANHGSTAYVYYDNETGSLHEDSYWLIEKSGDGYTIQNAQSKEYLIYKDERIEGIAKGIQLATSVTDDYGRWTFGESTSGHIYICNVAESGQFFNVRTDGTYLVGTYSSSNDDNSLFTVYDANGKSITDDGNGGTTGGKDDFTGKSGVTSNGEFWERTGLQQPVVYTTDINSPVLYSIRNLRSGMLADASGDALRQNKETTTKFYFVQNGKGVTVYSSNGKYVSTNFLSRYEGRYPLDIYDGTTSSNIWGFSFYNDADYPGYIIEKLDNLASTTSSTQSNYRYWNDYNLGSYRGIGLYDGNDNGSTFVFSSSDERHLEYIQSCGITIEGYQPTGVTAYIDSIRINDKDLVYDTGDKIFYYPLPTTLRDGRDFTGNLTVKMKRNDGEYTLRIDSKEIGADGMFTIPAVSCTKEYSLSIIKDGQDEVCQTKLLFTFLPIVEVSTPSCNGSYYTTGKIRVTDAETVGRDSTFIAAYKYRGATAQNYPKKSFAIKLKDENGESVDREFFGLRNDNNWILDAMAIDRACMRNRVSTDLWNDFSTKPYHRRAGWEKKARTGTRGRFVEVFLNGKYHGLYCMTEKLDRKQLKLKKYVAATATNNDTIHATLYKSTGWDYEVFMGHEPDSENFPGSYPAYFDNNKRKETWQNYEIKYPDWETEKIDWGPLWNAIASVATSTDTEFEKMYETYFDAPVIDDYYLFIELMLATDNHGKNLFFFNYDQCGKSNTEMIGIAPWDLDGTWGRRWDGSNYVTAANQDFTTFLWQYEHGTHTIFHRLAKSKTRKWKETLADRYAALRNQYFSLESLTRRFRDYSDLFAESNADQREQKRWNSLHRNIKGDVDYICEWIENRLDFLDQAYGYDPTTSGIKTIEDTDILGVAGGKGTIAIHSRYPASIQIYNLGGVLIRNVQIRDAFTEIDGFAPSVYIVAGKKVLVK